MCENLTLSLFKKIKGIRGDKSENPKEKWENHILSHFKKIMGDYRGLNIFQTTSKLPMHKYYYLD